MCVSNQTELDVSSISFVTCVTLVCTLHFCQISTRFRRASKRASSVAGTTVKGALFTFAGVCKKQGSIHRVCIKVLCFFGFGDKKKLLFGQLWWCFGCFWGVMGCLGC